jgi:hypothetical protein
LERTGVGIMTQRTVPLMTERDRDNVTDSQKKNGKDEDDGMSNLDEEVYKFSF